MNALGFTLTEIIDSVSESDKLKVTYLKGNIDKAIADLVYDKKTTRTAYSYYVGQRDDFQMQHLADNYGVGSPLEIPNMRLIARRINALIGKMLQNNLDYTVVANNPNSIDSKSKQKKTAILKEIQLQTKKALQENKTDPINEEFLKTLKAKYGEHFQADFEVAAADYLEYYKDAYEFKNISRQMSKDLLISGMMFWRTYVKEEGTDPVTYVCDPRELFYEDNPNSIWIKNSRRVVHRRYMNPQQIINELGPLMTKEDKDKVARAITSYYNERYQREVMFVEGKYGQQIAVGDTPRYQSDLIEVYHVEWLATNEIDSNTDVVDTVDSKINNIKRKNKRDRTDRYEGYRIEIGGGIYVGMGLSKFIKRSEQRPLDAQLTYNGLILYGDRSYIDNPFSMVMSAKDISDIYDITYFHLNNLLAAARPGGTITVLEHIPKEFGDNPEERLAKNTGYEKTLSQKLISLSQEGMEGQYAFNNYGQYSSNLDGSLVQAFVQYIELLEQQADKLLGLNQRMLGEVEERDGKSVTMQAITQGELLTKELFFLHSLALKQLFTDVINQSTLSYKDISFLSSYAVGDNYKIFTIGQEEYSYADFNLHIVDDIEEAKIDQKIDQLAQMVIQSNMGSLKDSLDLLVAKTLASKKQILRRIDNNMEENTTQQLQQASKQIEELTKQNEEMQKKIKQLDELDKALKEREIKIKEAKVQADIAVEKEKLNVEKEKVESKEKTDKAKVDIEKMQLFDNNKRNDSVYWNK